MLFVVGAEVDPPVLLLDIMGEPVAIVAKLSAVVETKNGRCLRL